MKKGLVMSPFFLLLAHACDSPAPTARERLGACGACGSGFAAGRIMGVGGRLSGDYVEGLLWLDCGLNVVGGIVR